MMGITKPLKCCQNVYHVFLYVCFLLLLFFFFCFFVFFVFSVCLFVFFFCFFFFFFFFKWWPWVDLDNFYDRVKFVSWCFCMCDSLYSIVWSCISKFAYPTHSGERYRTNAYDWVESIGQSGKRKFWNLHNFGFQSSISLPKSISNRKS